MVFTCLSPASGAAEPLAVYPRAMRAASFETVHSRPFSVRSSACSPLALRVLSCFACCPLLRHVALQTLSPVGQVAFFFGGFFCSAEAFYFAVVPLTYFCFCCLCYCCRKCVPSWPAFSEEASLPPPSDPLTGESSGFPQPQQSGRETHSTGPQSSEPGTVSMFVTRRRAPGRSVHPAQGTRAHRSARHGPGCARGRGGAVAPGAAPKSRKPGGADP